MAILPYFVAISAATTAVILFIGIYSMGAESDFNEQYSNRLMRWRVGMQALTLALIALYFLMEGGI
ncbi:MAG: twin transmembrane helix small protein [Rhodospirillales bacterium]|nr:twin transmembrane helix small protein [Rhodospirillales bacterium]